MEVNKIYQGDCLEVMKTFPDNCIDLTVTSPPYDNLRDYKGYSFDFENIANELYRVTKDGGVVVWVINDKKNKGSKTLTSFKQIIYFNSIGFNVHDVMIWRKPNPMPFVQRNCYTPAFEYMPVLSKGKPKTFNPIMEKCKYAGQVIKTYTNNPESIRKQNKNKPTKNIKIKMNVWDYVVAGTNYGHPAIFPEQLANDHIISWSNKDDIVLDPMCGSGTTCKMAKENGRKYIGIDVSKEYCEIARNRIKAIPELLF